MVRIDLHGRHCCLFTNGCWFPKLEVAGSNPSIVPITYGKLRVLRNPLFEVTAVARLYNRLKPLALID
jgi:hypothetical protein